SPYSVYSRSPIWKVDPNGDDDFFNREGKLLWRVVIDRNRNKIQIVDVPDDEFRTALELARKKYNGNIERMNSFMRAYANSLTELPVARKDMAITEHGKSVVRIAHFYKNEMGLKRDLSFAYAPEEDDYAYTVGP